LGYDIDNKIAIEGKTYTINWEYDNYYEIELNNKFGLIDIKTCKIAVEPKYNISYDDLAEIYNGLIIKSKMRIEK
jgi:hypothetical protein